MTESTKWKQAEMKENKQIEVCSVVGSLSLCFPSILAVVLCFPSELPLNHSDLCTESLHYLDSLPPSSSSLICKMSYKNKTSSPAGTLRLFVSFSTVLIRKQSTCGWGNKAHSIIYDTSLWIETSSWCFPLSLRLIFPSRRYLVFVRVEDAYGMTDLIVAGVFLLTGRAALQTDRASSADLHRCSLWESARLAADVRWWPERGSVTPTTTRGWAGGLAPLFQVHEREDLKDRVWLVSLFFNVFTLHLIQPV